MAGYLGSKAVLLSTTAASVTGNATIGGELSADTGQFDTSLNVDGTITSDGLTVDGGTAYHKLISTFPSTYKTNLQVGQQAHISNDAITDTLSIENTGTAGATNIQFSTAGSERMRITSTGSVGIGTTPSETLDVSGNIRALGANSRVMFGPDGFEAGIKYATDASLQIASRTGENITFNNGNDGTERMRIDSSGNVGIGTVSPQRSLSIGTHGSSSGAEIAFGTTSTGYASLLFGDGTTGTALYDGYIQYEQSGSNMLFATGGGSERMRIDGSGNFLLGKTSVSWTIDGTQIENGGETLGVTSSLTGNNFFARKNNATGTMFAFWYNSTSVGSITNTTSSVSYNTSSDYRLKENVVDLTGATTRLKQLEPKRFNFIADADTTVDGFLAHEVQSVVPEAITGTHNEVDDDGNPVYQGIDQSKLVPLLVATIKELEARITALENA